MTTSEHNDLIRQYGPLGYRRGSDGCDDTWDIVHINNGGTLTSIPFWDCEPAWMDRAEALARLFVASPDLLAALEDLLDDDIAVCAVTHREAMERAQAAIAKARGRD